MYCDLRSPSSIGWRMKCINIHWNGCERCISSIDLLVVYTLEQPISLDEYNIHSNRWIVVDNQIECTNSYTARSWWIDENRANIVIGQCHPWLVLNRHFVGNTCTITEWSITRRLSTDIFFVRRIHVSLQRSGKVNRYNSESVFYPSIYYSGLLIIYTIKE